MRVTIELDLPAPAAGSPRPELVREVVKDAMHAYLESPAVREKHDGLAAAGLLRPADVARRRELAKAIATGAPRVSVAP